MSKRDFLMNERVNKKAIGFLFVFLLTSFLVFGVENNDKSNLPDDALLISGCGTGVMTIIDRAGTVYWEYGSKVDSMDSWLLENGTILYAFKTKVVCIKPDFISGIGAETLWTISVKKGGETWSCQPLGPDRFLLGESRRSYSMIREVNSKGEVLFELKLRQFKGSHSSFRQIRKNSNGNYLVSLVRLDGCGYEISPQGKILNIYTDARYVAAPLKNGNVLTSGGDSRCVVEYSASGEEVWRLSQDDLASQGIIIGFSAGVQRLENGNTLICSWHGHKTGSGAGLFEVTPDKKVVWQCDSAWVPMIVSVMQIDRSFDR